MPGQTLKVVGDSHGLDQQSVLVCQDAWQPEVLRNSPYYAALKETLSPFLRLAQWPGLDQYQDYLDAAPHRITSGSGRLLRVVPQAGKTDRFEQRYLARVYATGEMQTRLHNWHDFFQVLTWRLFPQAKACLNARHYHAALRQYHAQAVNRDAHGRRSMEENLLSLFDEGGIVLLSDNAEILQAIRDFRWRQLFVSWRKQLHTRLRCIVFGHATYEKLIHPYIGLTGNAVLFEVSADLMSADSQAQLQYVDTQLAVHLQNVNKRSPLQGPQDLQPFPLLGLPGYWPGNDAEQFYDNERYFRPGRRRKIQP